jgi:ferric-dicitrate binding protein FerR (iron transport regulator)
MHSEAEEAAMAEGGRMLTESEQRAAIERLRKEESAGALTPRQFQALTRAVWASNTPHELYRRTRGRFGERRRGDHRAWWRSLVFYAAVAIAIVGVTWLTAMAAKDGLFGG